MCVFFQHNNAHWKSVVHPQTDKCCLWNQGLLVRSSNGPSIECCGKPSKMMMFIQIWWYHDRLSLIIIKLMLDKMKAFQQWFQQYVRWVSFKFHRFCGNLRISTILALSISTLSNQIRYRNQFPRQLVPETHRIC